MGGEEEVLLALLVARLYLNGRETRRGTIESRGGGGGGDGGGGAVCKR